MRFRDREHAGRLLGEALSAYRGQHSLVLAIPRGALPIGSEVARLLEGDLDIIQTRKIGAPDQPEFAIAAIDETGWVYRNPDVVENQALSGHIAQERERQMQLMAKRRALYTPGRTLIDPANRVVIVVDDGLATGSTMIAALHAIRAKHPARLVCAVPVAPPETLARIRPHVDDIVCLHAPPLFYAISQFYDRFDQLDDNEVTAILQEADRMHGHAWVNRPAGSWQAEHTVSVPVDNGAVEGILVHGDGQRFVLFVHGSGSSRNSPRNRMVAQALNHHGIGTLLFDLLTEEESRLGAATFNIELLSARLLAATAWVRVQYPGARLSIGYFGASTGAAAALQAAAQPPAGVDAVVSRGGRPDLAGAKALADVTCPTLLIVGGDDEQVLALNRQALATMHGERRLTVVPGASHLFEEPGTLERVAQIACDWFVQHLGLKEAGTESS